MGKSLLKRIKNNIYINNNYEIKKNDYGLYSFEIDGKIILKDCLKIDDFSEGFAIFVRKDGTMGWIDTKGKILAEGLGMCWNFRADGVSKYITKDYEEIGLIDKNGTKTILKEKSFLDSFKEKFLGKI